MKGKFNLGPKEKGARIRLADPGVCDEDVKAVEAVLRSGWLVRGERSRAFSRKIAEKTGRGYALSVSSGTAALLVGMRALGVGPGSTVLVPAFTFPAPVGAAAFLGAKVRLCDVDPETFNISGETLEGAMDSDVDLVVAVDQFGVPAPLDEIEELASRRKIPVLVDAACSLGSEYKGRPCGSFGRLATTSFHPRKALTTGEGGAVFCDDAALFEAMARLSDHGMSGGSFVSLGVNFRMSEAAAALGLSQLTRFEETVKRRRAIADRYRRALRLRIQGAPKDSAGNAQTLAAVVSMELGETGRDDLIAWLRGHGVEATVASMCVSALPGYSWVSPKPDEVPVAAALHKQGIALPLHPGLKDSEVDEVVALVNDFVESRERDFKGARET